MKLNSFFRFGVIGGLGFCVDAGTLYLLLFCGADYFSGRILSFLLAVIFTWQFNRRFTFAVRQEFTLWQEAWRYFAVSSLGGTVNIAVYSSAVLTFTSSTIVPLIGVALGSVAGMCVNYFAAKHFVFQSQMQRKP